MLAMLPACLNLTLGAWKAKPVIIATTRTDQGTVKLFLSEARPDTSGRDLVVNLPSPTEKGRDIVIAPQCMNCESGILFSRSQDIVVVATPSRVPQVFVVSKSGSFRPLETAFGHEDSFWVTGDQRVVFEMLDYKSGPHFLKPKKDLIFDPRTLKFSNLSFDDAKRLRMAAADRTSSKPSAKNL